MTEEFFNNHQRIRILTRVSAAISLIAIYPQALSFLTGEVFEETAVSLSGKMVLGAIASVVIPLLLPERVHRFIDTYLPFLADE